MNKRLLDMYVRSKTVIAGGSVFLLAALFPWSFSLFIIILLIYILRYEWHRLNCAPGIWGVLLTLFYPIGSCVCLLALNYLTKTRIEALFPFIIAWSYDTGAYLTGITWGTHKMCPHISPGKSWEGFFGGAVAVALVLYGFGEASTMLILFTGTILFTTAAFIGDIFISVLKRSVGLKDVGAVLPGHGGLLDRFDSVFVVAPLFLIWWGLQQ